VKILADQYPVSVLCASLGVSHSGYYAWRKRLPSRREQSNEALAQMLVQIHIKSRRSYGRPRLMVALREQGHRCSQARVARLMRQQGLRARSHRPFRVLTTDSRHELPIAPNRLALRAAPRRANEVWVTDITYIPTREGWLYLAAVMDLWSRRIVGWAMSESLQTPLVTAALEQALCLRRPPPGLLHHSDRGCQYASLDYRRLLASHQIEPSMSRAGNCYDNAAMESFWGGLKSEWLHKQPLATRAQTRTAIFEWIEVFYNRQRLHSSLGYQSPVDFETQLN
jgi:putative transposase